MGTCTRQPLFTGTAPPGGTAHGRCLCTLGADLVELSQLADCGAAVIHVGLGLDQEHTAAPQQAPSAGGPVLHPVHRDLVLLGQPVQQHKAHLQGRQSAPRAAPECARQRQGLALCLVLAYLAPGLPRPTMSHRSAGTSGGAPCWKGRCSRLVRPATALRAVEKGLRTRQLTPARPGGVRAGPLQDSQVSSGARAPDQGAVPVQPGPTAQGCRGQAYASSHGRRRDLHGPRPAASYRQLSACSMSRWRGHRAAGAPGPAGGQQIPCQPAQSWYRNDRQLGSPASPVQVAKEENVK